ncbi:MAG TPA: hypothetical protein PLY86_20955 [bacterium]|nr:hypothetical protein [bacterium]
MGACGCGDLFVDKVLKIGNRILGVQIYQGCQDCGLGLGITLHLFTPEEAKRWDIGNAELFETEQGYAQVGIELISREGMVEAAKELEKGYHEDPASDFVYDVFYKLIRGSINETEALHKKTDRERERIQRQ